VSDSPLTSPVSSLCASLANQNAPDASPSADSGTPTPAIADSTPSPSSTSCLASITQAQFDSEGTKTLAVTNTGVQAVDVFTTAVNGSNTNDFKINNDHCISQSLAPHATCMLDIVFVQNDGPGTKHAQVSLAGGDGQQLLSVTLVGVTTRAVVPPKAKSAGIPVIALLAIAAVGVIAVGSLYYLRVRRRKNLLKFRLEERE
jgi:hypothetical protein